VRYAVDYYRRKKPLSGMVAEGCMAMDPHKRSADIEVRTEDCTLTNAAAPSKRLHR
jgi:hypothetical protein